MEENHYYPFGMKHERYNEDSSVLANKYKYNGKEWQDELGLNFYDYGARNYDPAIGRWLNIDPLIELMKDVSTYSYAFNNPVYFIDDQGLIPIPQIVRSHRTSSQFGLRFHPIRKKMIGHGGIDLAASVGSDVRVAAAGTVAKIGWDPNGYGNYIIVKHINGYYSLYAHLDKVANGLAAGKSKVGNGDIIGLSGNTGGSTGPHLHFEIIKANSLSGVFNKNNKIDPSTIYDLHVHLYGNRKLKFNNSFDNPKFDFSDYIKQPIPHFEMPDLDKLFPPTPDSSNDRQPINPIPPLTPSPITPTPSPLPNIDPIPMPTPTPSPLPSIPNFPPSRID